MFEKRSFDRKDFNKKNEMRDMSKKYAGVSK